MTITLAPLMLSSADRLRLIAQAREAARSVGIPQITWRAWWRGGRTSRATMMLADPVGEGARIVSGLSERSRRRFAARALAVAAVHDIPREVWAAERARWGFQADCALFRDPDGTAKRLRAKRHGHTLDGAAAD